MPHNRKPRALPERDTRFHEHINAALGAGWGVELYYVGVADAGRANDVRMGLRRAARHLGVSCKAYVARCGHDAQCPDTHNGGNFHVAYSVYDKSVAREFIKSQGRYLAFRPPGSIAPSGIPPGEHGTGDFPE